MPSNGKDSACQALPLRGFMSHTGCHFRKFNYFACGIECHILHMSIFFIDDLYDSEDPKLISSQIIALLIAQPATWKLTYFAQNDVFPNKSAPWQLSIVRTKFPIWQPSGIISNFDFIGLTARHHQSCLEPLTLLAHIPLR